MEVGEKMIRDKAISAGIVTGFLALVTTNAHPQMWQVAIIGIGLYEAVLMGIREIHKNRRRNRYYVLRKRDGERWAETWIKHPMKEIS